MKNNKPQKPERKLKLGNLDGAAVIQTANIGGQTFAWLVEDDRHLVAIDGRDRFEEACKEWFCEWFDIAPGLQVNVHRATNQQGELFTVQIRRA